MFHAATCLCHHILVDGAPNRHHTQPLALFVHTVRDDLRARLRQLSLDEVAYIVFEHTLADGLNRREGSGNERDDDDGGHDAPRLSGPLQREMLMLAEAQQPHAQIGGKGDEYGINKKEVECAEEEVEVARCQSESSRAEGRHQGGGDGDTRDDVPLAARTHSHNARRTAEEGNQHIVERGRRTGQQLTLHLREGRKEEIDGGRQHTDERCHPEILRSPCQQSQVARTQRQPHADDRPHEGRNKHGADDDGCGVDVQPQRRNEYGKDEHPQIGAAKRHAAADLGYHLFFVLLIRQQVEIDPRPLQQIPGCHRIFSFNV